MSSNPLVPQPPTLLGNKTQNPTNFNDICQETNTQTEEKKTFCYIMSLLF